MVRVTFHLVNELISRNSSARRSSRRVSRLLRSSPTRFFFSVVFEISVPRKRACPATTSNDSPAVTFSRGRWNIVSDEKKILSLCSFAPSRLSLPRLSFSLSLSLSLDHVYRVPLRAWRSLPALPVSHAVEHAPPSPGGPCTCVRTTSGKPESILIVGTTLGVSLWWRRCPFIVGKPLYMCLHTATRAYFQQEHNIGKIKKNLEDFYFILPYIYRVGRLTLWSKLSQLCE